MAYIGKEPTTGNFIYADDITTSSTNTYNILVGGVAFSPESANHLIVSLNGVIQKANTSFSVSGSQITFIPSSGTLSSSDSIDFILILGSVNDVGVATTVSDSAITKSKLNLISDSSSAGLTVKGDGSSENGTIQLNCSQNSHGVKISSPAHSSGQSYEMVLPTTNITAGKFLKVDSVSGSGSTGIGQLSFADAGGSMTPVFFAEKNATQSPSNNAYTKITYETEIVDTDSAFSSSRFTVPSGKAGKYFIGFNKVNNKGGLTAEDYTSIYKNGSGFATFTSFSGSQTQVRNHNIIMDLAVSDYVEIYHYGTTTNSSAGSLMDSERNSFYGFKLIE